MPPTPKLPAPARPTDWRAHILKAFTSSKKVRFYKPIANPERELLRICQKPPEVLLDLLRATNGLYCTYSEVRFLLGAKELVAETFDARASTTVLAKLIVIGRVGADGILLVMPEGALANKVGAYDPIDDDVVWKCTRLSGLVNSWGDGSLSF